MAEEGTLRRRAKQAAPAEVPLIRPFRGTFSPSKDGEGKGGRRSRRPCLGTGLFERRGDRVVDPLEPDELELARATSSGMSS